MTNRSVLTQQLTPHLPAICRHYRNSLVSDAVSDLVYQLYSSNGVKLKEDKILNLLVETVTYPQYNNFLHLHPTWYTGTLMNDLVICDHITSYLADLLIVQLHQIK